MPDALALGSDERANTALDTMDRRRHYVVLLPVAFTGDVIRKEVRLSKNIFRVWPPLTA